MKDDYNYIINSLNFEIISLIDSNIELKKAEDLNNFKIKKLQKLLEFHSAGYIKLLLKELNWNFSASNLSFGKFQCSLASSAFDYQLVADYFYKGFEVDDLSFCIVPNGEILSCSLNKDTMKANLNWNIYNYFNLVKIINILKLPISNKDCLQETLYQYNLIIETNSKI